MSIQKKHQRGFTLIEIAIVLVIIGLLLGGVLKGQELIYNQKIKSTYDNYRNYTAAMYGYQDRFRALPGDDINALAHGFVAAGPAIVAGNGDGTIGATIGTACAAAGGEVCQANYHMRLAGFLSGAGIISATHPFGGVVQLVTPASIAIFAPVWTARTSVCWQNLSNRAAQLIDLAYDNAAGFTGSMRGVVNYSLAANQALPDTLVAWTCMTN